MLSYILKQIFKFDISGDLPKVLSIDKWASHGSYDLRKVEGILKNGEWSAAACLFFLTWLLRRLLCTLFTSPQKEFDGATFSQEVLPLMKVTLALSRLKNEFPSD